MYGIGEVKTSLTSADHTQMNCGMGIFKPGVVYWEENPEGRVIIDGKMCKIIKKSDALANIDKVTKANTLRFLFENPDYDPVVANVGSSGTWEKKTEFSFAGNIWDWTLNSGTSFLEAFRSAFTDADNLVSVIAAGDTSTITNVNSLFRDCTSLTSISLFDMSAVTNISYMLSGCRLLTSLPLFDTSAAQYMNDAFQGCSSLTSIPLFDTSAAKNVNFMFSGCYKVESGALALYQQMSSQATPPNNHAYTFANCGRDTETGAVELAQIPAAWGGTAE